KAPDGSTVFGTTGYAGSNNADFGAIQLTQAGTYTLVADARGDNTATYQFQIFDATPDVQTTNVGDVATGAIDNPGDTDLWHFSATAGQTIYFDAQDITGSNSLNLDFVLKAPDGSTVFGSTGYAGAPNYADYGSV